MREPVSADSGLAGVAQEDGQLVLDRETLADIFLGEVQFWNDSAIKATVRFHSPSDCSFALARCC